jgi:hypothetical protein
LSPPESLEAAAPARRLCRFRIAMPRSLLVASLLCLVPLLCLAAPPVGVPPASAAGPGELTVRLRIRDGERQYPARMLAVEVELDSGVRCVRPPCPEASRTLKLESGRDASIKIPVATWSQVRSIKVEGANALGLPGDKAQRLADGSFLVVVEAEPEAADEGPR